MLRGCHHVTRALIIFVFLFARSAKAQTQDKVIALQQAQIEQLTRRLNDLEARIKDGRLVVGLAQAAEKSKLSDRATAADRADKSISADYAASAGNADSANRVFTNQELRFFMNTSGNGGYMLVLEKDGNLIRWYCGNFGDFGTCALQKVY
jgi:hypothetical protein